MATKKQADERPDEQLTPEQQREEQNRATEAEIARRDEAEAGKAAAERESLPPDRADQAAKLKEQDPNAPSTAQVADPSATMSRAPAEGETGEAAAQRARTSAAAPANPGQPPGAVYPDRFA